LGSNPKIEKVCKEALHREMTMAKIEGTPTRKQPTTLGWIGFLLWIFLQVVEHRATTILVFLVMAVLIHSICWRLSPFWLP
jgi:hypothetical protein